MIYFDLNNQRPFTWKDHVIEGGVSEYLRGDVREYLNIWLLLGLDKD